MTAEVARDAAVSRNPATGEILAQHRYDSAADIERKLGQSHSGFLAWRRIATADRAAHLRHAGRLLEQQIDRLARRITREMGKPITASRAEVMKCATLCQWYADNLVSLLADEKPDMGVDGNALVSFLPLGTIMGIMPWNFPLWQVLRAAVPILGAGNAFLLKHADNVQGSAAALTELWGEAGLPDGTFSAINVHHTALADVIADRRIAGVTATAGVAAGRAIAAEAGRHLKKSVLELGGSDPFIVLADADLVRAVPAAVEARFQNSGQVCIAAKRLILERPIAEKFISDFVTATAALPMGDPLNPATRIGPLARHRLRDELHDQVERSLAMGAKRILGAFIPEGPGAFYPPTILTGVTPHMPVFREETFGPVAAITIAEDAEHAIRLANDSEFGLSGAIWSQDHDRALDLACRVATGGMFINGIAVTDPRVPIGGIKQSGYGRELSHFGLREFCNAQLRWVRN